jgi:hypothetical protein
VSTKYLPEHQTGEGGAPANPFAQVIRNPDGSWSIVGTGEGGGGTPGGLLPNWDIPNAHLATLPTSVPANIANSAPLGGVLPTGMQQATNAAAPSLGRRILDQILSPQGLATLAGTTAGLVQSAGGGIEDDPNAKALLEMALRRQQRTDPLHEQVSRLAGAMMPTAYQPGQK